MQAALDKLNINLNQNLWGLLISFTSLGISEYFDLKILIVFGLILSIISSLSYLVTTIAYTINYWKNKTNAK